VTDFISNVTSGKAPLMVQFEDTSGGNMTAWEWDFNSDGWIDSNEKNPVYEFKDPGTYNVTLRAGSGTAWGNITKANYITVTNDLQAGFTASPSQGGVPLTVQFDDTSTGNVTSWFWDFGDGNTSTSQNPIHIYYGTGDYTVTLNASNMYTYSVSSLEYISVTDETESGGSGSAGGSSGFSGAGSSTGGGGSPEPASNVEVKLQVQKFITAGNHIRFEFTKEATCIDFVEFDAKKTLGKTTTTIEQLIGKSVLTPPEPRGVVYKYLNIWVGNEGFASPENIENATVGFKVNKAAITLNGTENSTITLNATENSTNILNGTEYSTITLQRYVQGQWNILNTIDTGEDDKYIYFQAETPGFSQFVITSGSIPDNKNKYEKAPEDIMPSIGSQQPEKNNTFSESGLETKDQSGISRIILSFVGIMVIALIGLVVREKRKQ
jgi:PGF-pre-PGF domain-containing protein